MDKKLITKMINLDDQTNESDILRCLEKKISIAETAGSYKAQADFWQEQYQTLRHQCTRAINTRNGLKQLENILEEDLGEITN